MAFINSENEDEKDNSQGMNQVAEQVPTAPVQLSNQSSTTSAPAAPSTPAAKPVSSGSAPGFQNYTKANAGKAQDGLNQSVAQNVQNVGQKATNSINQATTSFGQKVDAGSLANRQNALQDVQNTVNSARNIQAGTNVDQTQQDRFKEVINTQYQGPESLRQSGLYNQASGNVQTAQNALNNTKNAAGREELLKGMYQKRGDYTAGLNKLDSALLNSSKQGVQNLQNVATQQGNIAQNLDKAQVSSANLAQNRTNEINQIKQNARDAFTTGKTAEEAATEERLKGVTDNWNALPDYFKNIITEKTSNGIALSPEEAAILGVQSGEGIYTRGANVIATNNADKTRLISKDEQARQAALSSLAGLDQSSLLSKNLLYDNAELAGTQTASDALDLAGTRFNLNEAEQVFRDTARNRDLTGEGSKKVSRGNAFGKKTKTYKASVGGNAGDFLRQAGYDLDSEIGQSGQEFNNQDLLRNYLSQTNTKRNNADAEDNQKVFQSAGQGAAAGAAAGSFIPVLGNGIGAAIGAGIGSTIGSGTTDVYQKYSDLARGMGGPVGAIGKGFQDVRAAAGKAVGSVFGKGAGGAVGGIDSGAMQAFGDANAKQNAIADLKSKYTNFLDTQGFENRLQVADNEQTNSRKATLQALLDSLDRTNIG